MRDWHELRQALAADISVEEREDGALIAAIGEISIQLEPGRAFDEPWLTAVAPIVFADQVSRPLDALELNAILSVGALAIAGGMLVLRWAWPLKPLDAETLDRYLRFLARETLRLRNVHAGLARPHSAVDYLAD